MAVGRNHGWVPPARAADAFRKTPTADKPSPTDAIKGRMAAVRLLRGGPASCCGLRRNPTVVSPYRPGLAVESLTAL
jgi:hypothetical protein